MTKKELELVKKALAEADVKENEQLDALPDAVMPNIEEFDKRMLSSLTKISKKRIVSPRKIAAILIAAVLMLSLAVTAYALREPLSEIYFRIFDNQAVYYYDSNKFDTVTDKLYEPTWLPDGFVKCDEDVTQKHATTVWSDGKGSITLVQSTEISGVIDTDGCVFDIVTVGRVKYVCVTRGGEVTAIFAQDDFPFLLLCDGVTKGDALLVAISVRQKGASHPPAPPTEDALFFAPSFMPSDYTEIDRTVTDRFSQTTWHSEIGYMILLQTPQQSSPRPPHQSTSSIIGNRHYTVKASGGVYIVSWQEGGHELTLYVSDLTLGVSDVMAIADGVIAVEP